jgi:hypothetical protein
MSTSSARNSSLQFDEWLPSCAPVTFSMHTEMLRGLDVECPLLCSVFNEHWNVPKNVVKKILSLKYHGNPVSGSRCLPCGQRRKHEDVNKGIFATYRYLKKARE